MPGQLSVEQITSKIHVIRDVKVMLDNDLAELYEIETKQLKRSVRRNIDRFPPDFMFEISKNEYDSLRRQNGTLERGSHSKYLPFAFTEQGVAMLSSVLNSKRAIYVNIQIMRIFTKLRQMLLDNADLRKEIEELKKITEDRFQIVFETLDHMLVVESKPKNKIGFTIKEKKREYGK
ncbi:MAG: ORF6N domain-containing protein [Desulfobacterales bacterium]